MNPPLPPSTVEGQVPDHDQELMMRFLVGEVSTEEREAVEQRFVVDPDYFEVLSALEHEMILQLVRNELPARWARPLAEALDSSPDRRRHLEEVRMMLAATIQRGRRQPYVRASWLQAAALIVAGVGLAAWWVGRPSPGPTAVVQPPVAAAAGDISATFLLVPGPTRSSSAEENVIVLPSGAEFVRLAAVLDGAVEGAIEARLRRVGGTLLDIPSAIVARRVAEGLEVTWLVPTVVLTPGDYLITYYAIQPTGASSSVDSRFLRIVP